MLNQWNYTTCSLLWRLPHPFAQCNALMLSKLLQVSTLSSLELLISELYFICYHSQGRGARLQFEATTNKISIYRFSGRHKISFSGKESSSKPVGHVTSAFISFKDWPSGLSEWLFYLQPHEIQFPLLLSYPCDCRKSPHPSVSFSDCLPAIPTRNQEPTPPFFLH